VYKNNTCVCASEQKEIESVAVNVVITLEASDASAIVFFLLNSSSNLAPTTFVVVLPFHGCSVVRLEVEYGSFCGVQDSTEALVDAGKPARTALQHSKPNSTRAACDESHDAVTTELTTD